jgi:hypothetical protein
VNREIRVRLSTRNRTCDREECRVQRS